MPVDFKLERLYAGFINSYTQLGLTVGNWTAGRARRADATHTITNWFRTTGIVYGYYPECERKQRDLEWFDVREARPVLHMETENAFSKAKSTVDKLIASDAEARIGLVWTNSTDEEVEGLLEHARKASENQDWMMLLIIRRQVTVFRSEEHRHGRVWHCPMQGHILEGGKHRPLAAAYIEWPDRWGQQVARWEPSTTKE